MKRRQPNQILRLRSAEEVRANMAAGQGRLLTSQEVSDAVMDLINSELTGASPVLPEGMV